MGKGNVYVVSEFGYGDAPYLGRPANKNPGTWDSISISRVVLLDLDNHVCTGLVGENFAKCLYNKKLVQVYHAFKDTNSH